jgi:high-affinity iron transporter
VLTYGGLLTIPTRYIFQVTSVLIALLAAGLAAQAVQFLDAAGVVTTLEKTVWDTSAWLSESSLFGKLLHTLIGYTERPSEMQLLVYVAVLVVMAVLMWVLKPPAKQPALAEQT